MTHPTLRIGIDLGGTKIEGVALDSGGQILARKRRPTPAGDYEGTVQAVAALVEEVEDMAGGRGTVGIGTPGSISPFTGVMRNSNSVALNGRALDRDLESAIGREIRLANDADCFTLAEAASGAGRGLNSVFGVILGTGVGGGLAVQGAVQVGPNRVTGEWGHNPQPGETGLRPCYCGRFDCVERYLSGPAVADEYHLEGGDKLAAEEIMGRLGEDDLADMVVDRYATRLARALAVVVNILDPEIVVLGGGLSNLDLLYRVVPKRWQEWIFSDGVATRLARNEQGDSGGVIGAAWLWPLSETA
ncbi:MAG: ROK family protein [bacterium]|nr:ROK family protein [bacterium]MCY3653196.1 ROK family protein [bacterium]